MFTGKTIPCLLALLSLAATAQEAAPDPALSRREAAIEASRPKPRPGTTVTPAATAPAQQPPATAMPAGAQVPMQSGPMQNAPVPGYVSNRPDLQPPTPPQVRYENGLLSIDANNSTLAEVLQAVRTLMGARIEGPLSGANDRVAARLGPAPPDDVLARLLNGSRFNYIIVGSAQNPNAIDRIVLSMRQGGPPTGPATGQPVQQPGYSPPPADSDEEGDLEEGIEEQAMPDMPDVPVPDRQQNQAPSGAPIPGQNNPDDPSRPKTPEELLQELQRMQQQQQQQQPQQNQPGFSTPGQPIAPAPGATTTQPTPPPTDRPQRPRR